MTVKIEVMGEHREQGGWVCGGGSWVTEIGGQVVDCVQSGLWGPKQIKAISCGINPCLCWDPEYSGSSELI